jgi:tagatose 6-phosphate kinase
LLHPALDVIYPVADFDPGVTLTDLPVSVAPSGKGVNVALAVKELGEEVTVIGLVPEIELPRFESFLSSKEIVSILQPVHGILRVNTTLLHTSSNMVTHLNSAGTTLSVRIQEEFLHLFRQKLSADSYWSFSGSIPQGFEDDIYAKMIKMCSDVNAHTLLDSRGTPLKLGIRARPAMIKPNHTEFEHIFDETIKGVHHIALKGKRLIDMGIGSAFISLGADGMIAIQNNDCLLCTPPSVKAIDTVGCGDALAAGLLVSRKRGFSFYETCRMAVACGASKAMHQGPGVISRNEVWQLMEDVKITAV